MNKFLLVAFLMVALAGCGGGGGGSHKYSSQVRDNFMKSCNSTSGGSDSAKKICECSFNELQKKYTQKEFAAIETKISQGGSPDELITIVTKCAQQQN